MSVVYYLSHPQVDVDPAIPVPDWGLSNAGRARLAALVGRGWLADVRRIVSSNERKAIETASILLPMTCGQIEIADDMHENDRSATGFLPLAEFEATADRFFANPEQSIRGWERAIDAQARITNAVRHALAGNTDITTLFVGHGGVGTLLRCAIVGDTIDRRHDQAAAGGHPGGGNVHAFEADLSRPRFGWMPMEELA